MFFKSGPQIKPTWTTLNKEIRRTTEEMLTLSAFST